MILKKFRLNTKSGSRIIIISPTKIKGKKVLPQVIKVREELEGKNKGRKFAVVGLFQRDKKRLSLLKLKKVFIKKRKVKGGKK